MNIGRSQAAQVSGEQIGGSYAAGHVSLREIFGSKQILRRRPIGGT